MPLTPAHAAAALPISWLVPALPLAPLVIGTLSPDFEYLVQLSPRGTFAHSAAGVVLFCVPASFVAWAAWTILLRPALCSLLPSGLPTAMGTRHRERAGSPMRRVLLGTLAIALGALSHVAWDAFTHDHGWAVARLPWLREEMIHGVLAYKVLQHVSSVAGIAVLVWWMAV